MKKNPRLIRFIILFVFSAIPFALFGADNKLATDAAITSETEHFKPAQTDWQELVELLARNPKILTMDWSHMRQILPVGCFTKPKESELDCPSMEGVVSISVIPGPTGVIDVVLKPPATCELVYNQLSRYLGKGKLTNGDVCDAEWTLSRWVKKAYTTVRSSRKDPKIIYLQFGTEQGP